VPSLWEGPLAAISFDSFNSFKSKTKTIAAGHAYYKTKPSPRVAPPTKQKTIIASRASHSINA